MFSQCSELHRRDSAGAEQYISPRVQITAHMCVTVTFRIWQRFGAFSQGWNLHVCLLSASNESRALFSLLSLMRDCSVARNYDDEGYSAVE